MNKSDNTLRRLTSIDTLTENFNHFTKLTNIDFNKLEIFLLEAGFAYEVLRVVGTSMLIIATKSIKPLISLQISMEQSQNKVVIDSDLTNLISTQNIEELEVLSSQPNLLAPGSEVILARQKGVKARIVKVVGQYALVKLDYNDWTYHAHIPLQEIQAKPTN